MTNRWLRVVAAIFALALVAAACGSDDDGDSAGGDDNESVDFENAGESADLLDTIRERGNLICGVNNSLSGFGTVDDAGEFNGFDIDYCKVVNIGIFGASPPDIEFVPLTAEQRFTALQSGEIDILIRNTTWTATRAGAERVDFGPTTFYDGQGFMTPASSGITDVAGMEGARICVLSGTTTELNLTSFLGAQGINFEPIVFTDNPELVPAYQAGQCEVTTSDKSQLASQKADIEGEGGEEQLILEPTISKEPLGPGILQGNPKLSLVMQWSVFATFQGEEFGITSADVDSADTSNPDVARFLGGEDAADVASGLDMDPEYAKNIIAEVGNYAEIYDRSIPPLGIVDRGVNQQWNDGGLLYSPPFR